MWSVLILSSSSQSLFCPLQTQPWNLAQAVDSHCQRRQVQMLLVIHGPGWSAGTLIPGLGHPYTNLGFWPWQKTCQQARGRASPELVWLIVAEIPGWPVAALQAQWHQPLPDSKFRQEERESTWLRSERTLAARQWVLSAWPPWVLPALMCLWGKPTGKASSCVFLQSWDLQKVRKVW